MKHVLLKSCILLLLVLFLFSSFVYALDSYTESVWRYDLGTNMEEGEKLAVDGSGNVYVNGYSYDWVTYSFFTLKYDPTGVIKWNRAFGEGYANPSLEDVAVDGSGNVFVTGTVFNGTNNDCLTVKYDKRNGKTVWKNVFNGGYTDNCASIVTDKKGNIYTAGTQYVTDTQYGYLMVKYDSRGNKLCSSVVSCDLPSECASRAMAIDGSGNLYVLGQRHLYYEIRKFNSSCGEVSNWTVPIITVPPNVPMDIAADSAGNVYVTGFATGIYGNSDYFLNKYSSIGDYLCQATYDSGSDDQAAGAAVDTSGNVYVTGMSNSNYATLKYDSLCNQLWTTPLIWDGVIYARANAIAVDGQANLYVTGNNWKSISLDTEAVTIKYTKTQ